MGITNLFNFLTPTAKDAVNKDDLRGKTIAVDTSCIIHKGLIRCSLELIKSGKSAIYINYVLTFAAGLRQAGVHPIFVFDGHRFPLKRVTHESREASRTLARAKVKSMKHPGIFNSKEAARVQSQAVEVTPQMRFLVREALKEGGFEVLTAPYEADCQLAHGCRAGWWWAVLSEDSDLIVFGCPRLITKWNGFEGVLYEYKDVPLSLCADKGLVAGKMLADGICGGQILPVHFTLGCVISGCDYVKSIKGIGLRKAFKYMRDGRGSMNRLLRLLRMEGYRGADQEYKYQVLTAMWGFYASVVYDYKNGGFILSLAPKTFDEEEPRSIRLEPSMKQISLPLDNDTWHECVEFETVGGQGNVADLLQVNNAKLMGELGIDLVLNEYSKMARYCSVGDLQPYTFEKFDASALPHPILLPERSSAKAFGKRQSIPCNTAREVPPAPSNTLKDYFLTRNSLNSSSSQSQRPLSADQSAGIVSVSTATLKSHNNLFKTDENGKLSHVLMRLVECSQYESPVTSQRVLEPIRCTPERASTPEKKSRIKSPFRQFELSGKPEAFATPQVIHTSPPARLYEAEPRLMGKIRIVTPPRCDGGETTTTTENGPPKLVKNQLDLNTFAAIESSTLQIGAARSQSRRTPLLSKFGQPPKSQRIIKMVNEDPRRNRLQTTPPTTSLLYETPRDTPAVQSQLLPEDRSSQVKPRLNLRKRRRSFESATDIAKEVHNSLFGTTPTVELVQDIKKLKRKRYLSMFGISPNAKFT